MINIRIVLLQKLDRNRYLWHLVINNNFHQLANSSKIGDQDGIISWHM